MMAPPTARGSPVAAAPAPPRTVAWRGVLRAAISTAGANGARQRRQQGPSQALGGRRALAARCNYHWRSGALRSAPHGRRLKIRKFRQPESKGLSQPGRRRNSQAFSWCALRPQATSNLTKAATVRPHPCDATRRFARSKTVWGTRGSIICFGANKITAAVRSIVAQRHL